MDRKEMKEMYKQFKPDMGVYVYTCKPTGKAYIGYGQNVKADINTITFQLKLGSFYSNTKSSLQDDWNKCGEANFEISVLDLLEYDKDETKTDYQEDLRILREFHLEKFSEYEFIQK